MSARMFERFLKDESGAVTVDWVVLTAGIVGLGLMVLIGVNNSLGSAATALNTDILTTSASATALN